MDTADAPNLDNSYLDFRLELRMAYITYDYDKRDDFDFIIIKFPYLSIKILACPALYGIFYFTLDTVCTALLKTIQRIYSSIQTCSQQNSFDWQFLSQ